MFSIQPDDEIDKYYNDKILEKITIQIGRSLTNDIFFRFDSF